MARIVELIHTEERRGLGTPDNPVRPVFQLWDKKGNLICEHDPEGKPFVSGFIAERL